MHLPVMQTDSSEAPAAVHATGQKLHLKLGQFEKGLDVVEILQCFNQMPVTSGQSGLNN